MQNEINALRWALRKAECVTVLAGATISAESGVPTFRGADGLWENYSAIDLATPEAFTNDPELVYNWRRSLISRLTFNSAHKALAELETRINHFTLVTQNLVLSGGAGETVPRLPEGWS